MIGPRKEYTCGCVYDTIDGERYRLVRCSDSTPHGENAELFRGMESLYGPIPTERIVLLGCDAEVSR